MNKKGFISMAVVYSFIIIFLMLILSLISLYSFRNKTVSNEVKETKDKLTNNLYKVTLEVINGISDSDSKLIDNENNLVYINITPNKGYGLENAITSCENNSTIELTSTGVKISNITINDKCRVELVTNLPTLAEAMLRDNPTISERTDFSVTNTSNTTGTLFKTNKTEDDSEVYYYSGNTTNNWVYFGGFYWRIIRSNEDGSVRLLYAGTSHDTTSGYITSSIHYNDTFNESRYVGYMYGGNTSLTDNRNYNNNSIIKENIDTWYQEYLLTNYDKYISKSAIYCNDRSISNGYWTNNGSNFFFYGAYTRLELQNSPTYKCGGNTSGGLYDTASNADKFSASTTGGGNGQLTYPIALMTADEVVFAGGKYDTLLTSPYAYYFSNSGGSSITGEVWWWLLSPYGWNGYTTTWNYFYVGVSELLGEYRGILNSSFDGGYEALGVRPVISIDECAKVTGTGTPEDPYKIVESVSTC